MADDFSVDPGVLEADARTWRDWAAGLQPVMDGLPRVPRDLTFGDFSVLPNADQVYRAYLEASTKLLVGVELGKREFEKIADRLEWAASSYRTTEEANLADIEALRGDEG